MMKDGKVEEGFFEEDGWFISIFEEDEVPEACEVGSAEKNCLFFNIPLEVVQTVFQTEHILGATG